MLVVSFTVDTIHTQGTKKNLKRQYIKPVVVWYFDCKLDEKHGIMLDQGCLLQEIRDTQPR